MTRRITISVAQAAIVVGLLVIIPISTMIGAQWKYGLLDRAQVKLSGMLSPPESSLVPPCRSDTSVTSLDSAPANPALPYELSKSNLVLNSLNVQGSVPAEENRALFPGEDQDFIQSRLNIIFPQGRTGLSDEEVSIEILRYITSTLRLESNSGSATKILHDGYAICKGMSISFEALARLAGLPTRSIGLFGTPIQGNHSVVEVFYENQWHLYDPTYGMFFYSRSEYDKSGLVASLNDLFSGSAKDWYLFKVVAKPWIEKYDSRVRSFGPVRVEQDYLTDFYGYPFVEEYRKMFTAAFPVAYAPNQVLSFPVDVDFSTKNNFSVGVVNSSGLDIVKAAVDSETAGNVGSPWLGDSTEEVHTWFIKAPSTGFVHITYFSVDNAPPLLILFPLKAAYVVKYNQEQSKSDFLIYITAREASLQFWAAYGLYTVDAIQAEWLGNSIDQ